MINQFNYLVLTQIFILLQFFIASAKESFLFLISAKVKFNFYDSYRNWQAT